DVRATQRQYFEKLHQTFLANLKLGHEAVNADHSTSVYLTAIQVYQRARQNCLSVRFIVVISQPVNTQTPFP
ncbi:MAG: hypothetical protein Q8L46_02635, partial [candidate division WWE3 bacterium]|nr:hypothetical protein [candidate division WWE3 bacterium]